MRMTGVPLSALLARAGMEEDALRGRARRSYRGTPTEKLYLPVHLVCTSVWPGDKAVHRNSIAYQMMAVIFRGSRIPLPPIVPRSLWNGVRKVADAYPRCTEAV